MLPRIFALAALGSVVCSQAGYACEIDEVQKLTMVSAWCRHNVGVAPVRGCTSELMKSQAADQLEQIALARRCGFMVEADNLEKYYKATTPIIAKLYSCADMPIDQADVELRAKQDVDKKLTAMPEGCSDDLRRQLAGDLPKLIESDRRSYSDAQHIAETLKLK